MLSIEHEELLDKLFVEPLNEEIEAQREYILEHEDFVERYWTILLGDSFVYHKSSRKRTLEALLDTELSDNEYEHLTTMIDEGDISYSIEVNGYYTDPDFATIASFPLGEQEYQFSRKSQRLIDALLEDEFEYVTNHLEAYMNDRNKDLCYLNFGHRDQVELWVSLEELETELKSYRNDYAETRN